MTDTLMFTCEHGGNRVPARYRALMPVAVIEKLSLGIPAMILLSQDRVAPMIAAGAGIDLLLGVLFAVAYVLTPRAHGAT